MKAEKIEKHMRKRTVVRGQDKGDTIIGVITTRRGLDVPLGIEGMATNAAHDLDSFAWFAPYEVRKATDAEREQFFAWLISDGTDIADGFARFGGAPRGFEEWRAAQNAPAEVTPEPAVPAMGWMFTLPAPKHKRGDVRVWLRSKGTAGVARVTSVDDDGDVWTEEGFTNPDKVYEPTRENVAMLVEKQRERGIEPEVGDLVYVIGRESGGMLGRTALVMDGVGAEMLLACAGYRVPMGVGTDPLILVIRRNPLREVGDA